MIFIVAILSIAELEPDDIIFLDNNYLRLDTSNDPLTNHLDMDGNEIQEVGTIDFILGTQITPDLGELKYNADINTFGSGAGNVIMGFDGFPASNGFYIWDGFSDQFEFGDDVFFDRNIWVVDNVNFLSNLTVREDIKFLHGDANFTFLDNILNYEVVGGDQVFSKFSYVDTDPAESGNKYMVFDITKKGSGAGALTNEGSIIIDVTDANTITGGLFDVGTSMQLIYHRNSTFKSASTISPVLTTFALEVDDDGNYTATSGGVYRAILHTRSPRPIFSSSLDGIQRITSLDIDTKPEGVNFGIGNLTGLQKVIDFRPLNIGVFSGLNFGLDAYEGNLVDYSPTITSIGSDSEIKLNLLKNQFSIISSGYTEIINSYLKPKSWIQASGTVKIHHIYHYPPVLGVTDFVNNIINAGSGNYYNNNTDIKFMVGSDVTGYQNITSKSGGGIFIEGNLTINENLHVRNETKIGDLDNENYIKIESDGDINFVNGSGLQYGEIWFKDNTDAVTLNSAGIVQILNFDNNGSTNGNIISNSTSSDITIGEPGDYFVSVSSTVINNAAQSHIIDVSVYINNGAVEFENLHVHRSLTGGSGDVGSIGLSGIINVTNSDTIEIWATTDAAADRSVTFEDLTLSIMQIGG